MKRVRIAKKQETAPAAPIKKKRGLTEGKPIPIWYKYATENEAKRAAIDCARRTGLRDRVFNIVTDGERWGFASALAAPKGSMPVFKKGDMVFDPFIANSLAKIIVAGPEQSEIEYETERKGLPKRTFVSNVYLSKTE